MTRTAILLATLLAGCLSTETPETSERTQAFEDDTGICFAFEPGAIVTPEQCACNGGTVNASWGGRYQPHCSSGSTEIGRVRFGIEGGWCCQAVTP